MNIKHLMIRNTIDCNVTITKKTIFFIQHQIFIFRYICFILQVFIDNDKDTNAIFADNTTTFSSLKLPVMLYFHGHTFNDGAGSLYDGSVLSNHGDVIVVTFNYRLGVLGTKILFVIEMKFF